MDLASSLDHPANIPSGHESQRFPALAVARNAIESSFSGNALRIRKTSAGFSNRDVVDAIDLIEKAEGWVDDGSLKYLVIDFDHSAKALFEQGGKTPAKGTDFAVLLHSHANLVLRVPVISVAIVRSRMAGSDLLMALSCNVLLAEEGASFVVPRRDHAGGGVFGFLESKLGATRARDLEGGAILSAAQMQSLMLVREVFSTGEATEGAEKWMAQALRRHNAAYLTYRAQRVVAPVRWAEVAENTGA